MLMGIFITSLILVGAFGGFMFARYFVKRGAGMMQVCGTCKFKNVVAEALHDEIVANPLPKDIPVSKYEPDPAKL